MANHDHKLAEGCYREMFYSLQFINFTVLYMPIEEGGFDFSKKRLLNFNRILTENNRLELDGQIDVADLVTRYKKVGLDCEKEASEFPYRAKVKMVNTRLKSKRDYYILLNSANGAIKLYLALAVYTLKKSYGFSWDMIHAWWVKCKEVAELYSKGMTDEFVMQYFKDVCDLDIEKG